MEIESNNTLEQQLIARDLALLSIKEQLSVIQNRMKKYTDQKRQEVNFEVGDMVYLKLRPFHQKSLAKKRCEKLSPKFFDPYEERVGTVAYRLKLPPSTTILSSHSLVSARALVICKEPSVTSEAPPSLCWPLGLQSS